MAASVLLQSVPIAIRYVNCYVKHTGLTFFIKMTHGFNLGRYVWRKYYFKPGACCFVCHKIQTGKIYIQLWNQDRIWVSSLFIWNSAQLWVSCSTWKYIQCLNVQVKLKIGPFVQICVFVISSEVSLLLSLNQFGA